MVGNHIGLLAERALVLSLHPFQDARLVELRVAAFQLALALLGQAHAADDALKVLLGLVSFDLHALRDLGQAQKELLIGLQLTVIVERPWVLQGESDVLNLVALQ